MKNRIALLIPAYNAEKWLPRLLSSALSQSVPFDDIVVYDDCSSDSTKTVAESYGVRTLRGDKNVGCSAGKNRLAYTTDCDWIHFHDADDELKPNFVALAQKWIKSQEFDVLLFSYEYRDNDTNKLLLLREFSDKDLQEDPRAYAVRNQINPFCGLYKTASFLRAGGYDEDPAILYNEDVAFHIKLAFFGSTFRAESGVSIINYRIKNSMSAANRLKCLRAQHEVMQRTLLREGSHAYARIIAQKLWGVAGRLAAERDWQEADRAALTAAKICSPDSEAGGRVFGYLAKISPCFALRFREHWIRIFKPTMREATSSCKF